LVGHVITVDKKTLATWPLENEEQEERGDGKYYGRT